jgi:hypothetical protein
VHRLFSDRNIAAGKARDWIGVGSRKPHRLNPARDQNGKTDYALFKPGTRQTAIYYLAGPAYVSSAYGPTIASGYELTGPGDFNGDGKPDYVLYNPITRRTELYYLNNNVFLGSAFGPTLTAGWNLVVP